MGLSIAVCEDEPKEYELLEPLLYGSDLVANVDFYPDGSELVSSFFPGKYDLILLDVFMKKMGGLDTVARIRQSDREVPVAFLTSSKDFALEAFQHHVFRYLVKPPKKEEVDELLETADRLKASQPALTIRSDGQQYRLPIRQIRYVEQNNHRLYYYMTGGEEFDVRGQLDEVEQAVPCPPFYRCHKSFLVNLTHVKDFDEELNVFEMSEGGTVYVRKQSAREAVRAFRSFMFAQTREDGA